MAPAAVVVANTAALERHSAALETLARELAADTAALLQQRQPPAAAAGAGPQPPPPAAPPAPAAASWDAPPCPAALRRLKAALDAALAAGAPVTGHGVLLAAGAGTTAAAWARLRVLLVVYHPANAVAVAGAQLAAGRDTALLGHQWVQQGQLHQLVVTDGRKASTCLNHVARYLLDREDVRRRCAQRLLADATRLAQT